VLSGKTLLNNFLTELKARDGVVDLKVGNGGQSTQISVFLTFLDRTEPDLRLE